MVVVIPCCHSFIHYSLTNFLKRELRCEPLSRTHALQYIAQLFVFFFLSISGVLAAAPKRLRMVRQITDVSYTIQ
jgi:hypothetical protein